MYTTTYTKKPKKKLIAFKVLVLVDDTAAEEHDYQNRSLRKQSQYRQDLTKLVKDVRHSIRPTHIIVQGGMCNLNLNDCPKKCPFFECCDCTQEKECDSEELEKNKEYFKGVDFIRKLLDEGLLDHFVRYPDENGVVCFAAKNVYLSEACVLTSLVGIDIVRCVKNFVTLRKDLK